MDKGNVAHPQNRILLSNEKEQTTDAKNDGDASEMHYAEHVRFQRLHAVAPFMTSCKGNTVGTEIELVVGDTRLRMTTKRHKETLYVGYSEFDCGFTTVCVSKNS